MHTPTTINDVLAHVRVEQGALQAELDELYAQAKAAPLVDWDYRVLQYQIAQTHGRILSLSAMSGYLEARIDIDQIYAEGK